MNKVILLGFISQEPEYKEIKEKNLNIAKFSLLVNDSRSYNQSFFFNCVAWNQTADYVNSNLHKGDFIAVDGRLTNRSYIDKTGKKVYITEIMADNIKNLGSKRNINDTQEITGTNNNVINQDVVDVDQLISNSSNNQDDLLILNDDKNQDNQDNNEDDFDDVDWD